MMPTDDERRTVADPWGRPYRDVSDAMLTDCCRMCGEYAGEGHDYAECGDCPVLRLYADYFALRLAETYKDGREMGQC